MTDQLDQEFMIEPERYELFAPAPTPFEVDRRGFLGMLSGGLLVLCLSREAEAQQEAGGARRRGGGGGGGPAPKDVDAWLHIGESGAVTVYTGKAEVGQNIRTSL